MTCSVISPNNIITATGINKSFCGKLVLDDVNLSLPRGRCAVIVGRNGAGKSTLLSILSGYLKPDSGIVDTSGCNVAFCPQDDDLFEELTVRDNILFWSRAKGKDPNPNTADLFELFEVKAYERKRIRHLSGGMKKSVAVICAMTGNPQILVLDEPFTSLDILNKNALMRVFETLIASGLCIIYTSHNVDEIMGTSSDIYTLSGGKLTYFGNRDDLLADGTNVPDTLLNTLV